MTRFHHRPRRCELTGLVAGLRAHAQGVCAEIAAVELLIAHRFWLTRDDFRDQFVHHDSAPRTPGVAALARVDWTGAAAALESGRLACSSGEGAVLHIAIALATGGPFSASVLTSLDRGNFAKVLTATVRAGGHTDANVAIR
ncbi:hypothetical protein amrb99_51760 [Actinomadura sp. RB99]|uniref:hypothetical protein n=1 Tax=Actinomadura sp. RB99 TaxID=2691577 RepID=UPI001685F84C|nr:hypothetical protein [Actinomadura sp. RB99]MBD2896232.1 hypothetical protein [Actinomadura sp. RB99]